MLKLVVIGLGGFIGAVARYGISGLVHRYANPSFPYGTLAVNVLGCLLIGGLMYFVEMRQAISPHARLFLMVGLLGSLTTFSTVGYETFDFLRTGDYRMAMVNIASNILIGVTAVVIGWMIVKTFSV